MAERWILKQVRNVNIFKCFENRHFMFQDRCSEENTKVYSKLFRQLCNANVPYSNVLYEPCLHIKFLRTNQIKGIYLILKAGGTYSVLGNNERVRCKLFIIPSLFKAMWFLWEFCTQKYVNHFKHAGRDSSSSTQTVAFNQGGSRRQSFVNELMKEGLWSEGR